MSLYTDGTQINLPSATVVPGVIDPTLYKKEDVAVPGGRPINMSDYAADPTEAVIPPPQNLMKKKPMKLGDALHFDSEFDPHAKKLIQATTHEPTSIPATTLTTDDRFRAQYDRFRAQHMPKLETI